LYARERIALGGKVKGSRGEWVDGQKGMRIQKIENIGGGVLSS
jgi:hypothetical protein